MGRTEFEKVKKRFHFQTSKTDVTEKFRFGPSKVYESTMKVKLQLTQDMGADEEGLLELKNLLGTNSGIQKQLYQARQ